jgi:hypothetical protein
MFVKKHRTSMIYDQKVKRTKNSYAVFYNNRSSTFRMFPSFHCQAAEFFALGQNHLLYQYLINFCSWFQRYTFNHSLHNASIHLSVSSCTFYIDSICFCSFPLNISHRIVDGKDGERYLMEAMNALNVLKQLTIW